MSKGSHADRPRQRAAGNTTADTAVTPVALVVTLDVDHGNEAPLVDLDEHVRERQAQVDRTASSVIATVERMGAAAGRPSWLTDTLSVRVAPAHAERLTAALKRLPTVRGVATDAPVEFDVPIVSEQHGDGGPQ